MKVVLLGILVFLASVAGAADIKIYSAFKTGSTESLAVTQLKEYLSRIYVNDQFNIFNTDSSRCNIYVSLVDPQKHLNGYQIKSDGKKIRIAAADNSLLMCAVYDFLEQQGCYFQLSEEFVPVYTKRFVIPALSIQNKALAKKRIIFNWFNFLSGCSAWDLEDWKLYIRQAVKLKYNNLMVHAYGNNPMIEFSFNGQTKPIGFLASTDKGRDWGTQHVTDVRTMPGAAGIFKSSVFSSEAANASSENRHIMMKSFMNQVFDYAHLWGMKVMLAYDMDSKSVNPQNIIRTLADSSCIFVGGGAYALANPDSPEGYAYYKTQLQKILEDYPQVDEYVLWGRGEASLYWSLWGSIKMEELPRSWQQEYKQYIAATPGFADSSYNYSIFAWAKMANTYQRILKDLKRDTNTTLSVGSWKFDFIPILNRFANKDITFIALDFKIEYESKPIQQLIVNNSQQRRIIPVFWVQHDDFAYIGRPYLPYQKLASGFKSLNIADFGIIHWTTRPLDIYFKNTMEQLWSNTADQPLIKTTSRYCNAVFGTQSKIFNNYLIEWLKEAPIFGRETTNYFITKPLKPAHEIIKQSAFRYTLLQSIDTTRLTTRVSNVVSYYKHYEKFIQSYHLANMHFDSSLTLLRNNQVHPAKQMMSGNLAKESILLFSQAIKYNGPDKGEMGLLVSLNTRWYPYILAQQQVLGLAPVSYLFKKTAHESLAQEGGSFTFAFDKHELLSKVLGEQETGLTYFEGNGFSGLKLDSLFTFNIKTISGKPISSATGNIEVDFYIDQTGSASIADSIPIVLEITNGGKIISRKTYLPRSKNGIQKLVLPVSFQNNSDPKTDLLIHTGAYKILLNGISFQSEK